MEMTHDFEIGNKIMYNFANKGFFWFMYPPSVVCTR
jgi:hypothetical protein